MCGIYGIFDCRAPIDTGFLQHRNDLLSHRGPDDSGSWLSADRRLGLAQRRLSIIDLTPTGHQPMARDEGRCAIVYNGEVYNFVSLRAELAGLGHDFKGSSDTEVVLASYREWGENCLRRFNGMFAFAIYDAGDAETPPTLFFARDRAGEKPFYYCHEARRFQFGSELKAIDIHSGIDVPALNAYLALGYVPWDLCLAKGVCKLPPGHAGRLDLNTNELHIWRYWEVPPNTADPHASSEDLADEAYTLLSDATKLRLVSDVPIGVLLSGGTDSSLITAAAAQQTSGSLATFTISNPGTDYDELRFARRISEYFATDHHVLELGPASLEVIEELAPFIDEPIADSSILPTFMVAKMTRHHVKVVLGGDGGDEVFGGYSHYQSTLADETRLSWIPKPLFRAVGWTAARLPVGVRGRNRLASLSRGPLQQMILGTPYFDPVSRQRILRPDTLAVLDSQLAAPEQWRRSLYQSGSGTVDKMTRTDFGSILADNHLVKVDRSSMANSLEIRSPLLDHRLVEFSFSCIPDHWKVANGETRRIQRIMAARVLPPGFDAGRKQGFSVPLDDWLRADNCRLIRDRMSDLPDVICRSKVDRLIAGEMRGRANSARLFALLMLAIAAKNNGW